MTEKRTNIFDEATICRAAHLLLAAAPGARVILFGSYAHAMPTPDSDLDFLVVEPQVDSCMDEMVRLRDVLRPLRVAADILVTSEAVFQQWSDTPGTVHHQATNEGRVFHDVA